MAAAKDKRIKRETLGSLWEVFGMVVT